MQARGGLSFTRDTGFVFADGGIITGRKAPAHITMRSRHNQRLFALWNYWIDEKNSTSYRMSLESLVDKRRPRASLRSGCVSASESEQPACLPACEFNIYKTRFDVARYCTLARTRATSEPCVQDAYDTSSLAKRLGMYSLIGVIVFRYDSCLIICQRSRAAPRHSVSGCLSFFYRRL